jgi:hypothetical protein
MNTKPSRVNLAANREHRASGEDFHLRVAPKYIELLNSLPDFQDLSLAQLLQLLPSKYRKCIPLVEDREARAAIIGMLAPEAMIEYHISMRFLTRSISGG